jgi:hypothetical protein
MKKRDSMRKPLQAAALLALPLLLLAACGVGSDGDAETPQQIVVGGPGRTTVFGSAIQFGLPRGVLPNAVALLEDGRLYASFLEGALLVGTYRATKAPIDSGARVVGSAKLYASSGDRLTLIEPAVKLDGMLFGTALTSVKLDAGERVGTTTMLLDELGQRAPDVARLSGGWKSTGADGLNLTLDSRGNATGSAAACARVSVRVSGANARSEVYAVELDCDQVSGAVLKYRGVLITRNLSTPAMEDDSLVLMLEGNGEAWVRLLARPRLELG